MNALSLHGIRVLIVEDYAFMADLIVSMLREVGDLKVRQTGKRSKIAESKKLIGKVAADKRGAFGQLVQTVENRIVSKIAQATSPCRHILLVQNSDSM